MMLRRNAMYLAALVVVVVLTGCADKKTEEGTINTGEERAMYYTEPATDTPATEYEPADVQVADATTPPSYMEEIDEPPTRAAVRYHVVAKKDTLYSLARKYYGDQSRWKDIYKANRDKIANPNLIYVGQRLVIP